MRKQDKERQDERRKARKPDEQGKIRTARKQDKARQDTERIGRKQYKASKKRKR